MTKLNADVLLLILNNLGIEDKVRLERVSQEWRFLLLKTWRTVHHLSLESFLYRPFQGSERRDAMLQAVLKRCGDFLENLSLASHADVLSVNNFNKKFELTGRALVSIAEFCPKLKNLQICCHIFPSITVFNFLTHLPDTLERLDLDFCRLEANCEGEGQCAERTLERFLRKFENLQFFSMAGRGSCYGYLKITSELVAKNAPKSLRYVNLSAGQALKVTDLNFVSKLPRLESLFLSRSNIKEQDLEILASKCPQLKELDLSYSREIRDFSSVAELRNLELVVLDGNREYLTDFGLAKICSNCTKLRSLSLESCTAVSGDGLITIANLQRLEYLSVCGLAQFNNICLAEICAFCSQMRQLQMKYCRRLTKDWLLYLKWLPKLEQLGANGIFGMDEDVLTELINNTNLRAIDAVDCPALKIDRTKYLALNLRIVM